MGELPAGESIHAEFFLLCGFRTGRVCRSGGRVKVLGGSASKKQGARVQNEEVLEVERGKKRTPYFEMKTPEGAQNIYILFLVPYNRSLFLAVLV